MLLGHEACMKKSISALSKELLVTHKHPTNLDAYHSMPCNPS